MGNIHFFQQKHLIKLKRFNKVRIEYKMSGK